jgi:hypothetical protein
MNPKLPSFLPAWPLMRQPARKSDKRAPKVKNDRS